jgi:RNA polymerase sigma-70 factor (ECF subfamily)
VDELAAEFETHRAYLHAVARRMLGSPSEADDAVQEAWLRLSRTGAAGIADLRSWLVTVVARISLNALRSRSRRAEEPLAEHLPDPVLRAADPATEAELADSVGLALLVVLDTLTPAERLAFVLHDTFGVPFTDIGRLLGRTPAATRQLASRARRRVRAASATSAGDPRRQREVVDAFFAAGRSGDFDRLVGLLHPDVVLRADGPGGLTVARGRDAVGGRARLFAGPERAVRPMLVDGAAGALISVAGRPVAVMAFTVRADLIVAIDAITDPARVTRLL